MISNWLFYYLPGWFKQYMYNYYKETSLVHWRFKFVKAIDKYQIWEQGYCIKSCIRCMFSILHIFRTVVNSHALLQVSGLQAEEILINCRLRCMAARLSQLHGHRIASRVNCYNGNIWGRTQFRKFNHNTTLKVIN